MYTPVIVPAPTSEQNNVDLHKVVLQLEALKDERERYMKEVKTEVLEINEGTMDSLRTAHAATVEAFRAAHAATVAAKDEQINSLKGGGNDALQREHEARMNRLRDQYRTDLQQQEQRSARDKDAQDQELQRVRREHEMALANLKQAYDANIATKDEMIDALKRAHVQVQEAATAAASRESPEQQQQRLAELAHRTQAIASEIAQREQQIAADITHRLAQQAAEERQHRLNDRSAMTNDGAALNALKDRHADAMRALSASHADTVAAKDDIIAMLQGKPPPPRNNPYNNNYNPYGGASSGMLADPRDRSYADSAPYDRSGRGPYPRDDHLIDAYGQRAPPRGFGDEYDGGRQQRSPYGSNRDPPSARYGRGGATHRYGDGDGDDDDGGYGYARRAPPTPTLEDRLQEEMRRQRGQLPQFWQAAEPMANWHKADDAGALADVLRDQRGVREVDTTNSPTTPALGYLEYLLSQLPQLETLTMDLGAYRFVRDPHAMDAVRRPFSKLRILRLRHCSNAALADMVKVLRHGCPKLEEIQLQQCKQLTDIYPLVDLPHVAKLDVKDSGVGDIFKVMREPTRPTSSVPRSSTNTTAREDPRSKRRDNKRNDDDDDDDDDERARSSARSKSDEKSARQREKDREREERHRKKEEERQRQREKEREREERAARKKNEADQRQREKEEKERKKEEAERERSARKKEREREERAARKKEEADQRQREKDAKERERSARKKERENEKQRQQERQLAKDAKQREKEKEKERKQREKDRKRTPSPSSTKHSPTRSRNSSSSSSGASAHRTPTPRSAKPSTPPSATRDSQGYWQHDDRGSAQPQDPRYSVDRSSHQPLSCSERAELSDRENSPARHQQQPSRSSASSAAGDTPGSSDADSSHNNSGGSASKSMGLNEETLRGEPAVSPEKTPRKSSSKSSHQPSRQPSGALRSGDHSTPRKPSQQLSAQPSSAQQLRSGDRSAPLHSQPSSGVKSRSSPQQQKDALRSPKRTSTGSSDSDRPSSVPTSSTATTLSSVGARHMDRRELPPLPSPDHVQVLSTQQLYPPINYTAAYGIMFELESRVDIILEEIFFEPMASRPRGAARWFWREGGLENMEIHPDEWYEVGKQPKIKLIEGNLYSAGRLALPMKAGQRYSIYESINDGVGLKVMKNIMGHLGKIGDLYKRDRSLAIFVGRFSGPPAPFCNLGSEEFPVAFCGRITYQLADGASPKKSKSGEAKKDKKKRK